MNGTVEHVRRRLEKSEVGDARSAGGLTLVPLFGGEPAPDYIVAAEAIASGLLEIEEIGSGEVPNLTAINRADLPVLLLDGEHLIGAKQNRIINVTVLLAPHSKTILPVSCVEQRRWHYDHASSPDKAGRFTMSLDHANSRLRRVQAERVHSNARMKRERRADQGEVWAAVADYAGEVGARSMYGAVQDVFDHKRGELLEMQRACGKPADGQTGVAAFVGGQPLAVDVFDRAETLSKVWSRLISGYSLDALGFPGAPVEEHTVREFLADAIATEPVEQAGIGLGTDLVFGAPRVVGNVLIHEGAVVHMALFARETPRRPSGDPIQRPSRRARRFFHLE